MSSFAMNHDVPAARVLASVLAGTIALECSQNSATERTAGSAGAATPIAPEPAPDPAAPVDAAQPASVSDAPPTAPAVDATEVAPATGRPATSLRALYWWHPPGGETLVPMGCSAAKPGGAGLVLQPDQVCHGLTPVGAALSRAGASMARIERGYDMECGDFHDPNPPKVPAFDVEPDPAVAQSLDSDYLVVDWPSGAATEVARPSESELGASDKRRLIAAIGRDLVGKDEAFAVAEIDEIEHYRSDLDGDGRQDSLYVVMWRQLASAVYSAMSQDPTRLTLQASTPFGHYSLRGVTDLDGDGGHELVFCKAIDAVDERIFVAMENGRFRTLANHYCTNCQ